MRQGQLKLLVLLSALISFPLGLCWAQEQQKPKQNPPGVQQEEQEYTEEEYDAYDKAVKEPDLEKRGSALIAFMEKYPKSKLQPHIVAAYQTLAYELRTKKEFDKLLSLAERWLKFFPDDLQTIAYAAEAANQLGNTQKYFEYALKIYSVKPAPSLAYEIMQTYKKLGDEPKYLEWISKVLAYPEYAGDFKLRMDLVEKYAQEKNLSKAAEYAQVTLKSLATAKKPDSMSEADWQKGVRAMRRACNWFIGLNDYEDKKYPQAVQAFENALKVEVFPGAFYYIGMCQWRMDQVEEATVSFAAAELMKGEFDSQAKEHLEELYKALHNGTTVGIDKVYKKGQARIDAAKAAAK